MKNVCVLATVNMAIAKSGYKTGYTTGKITGLNASVRFEDGNKYTIIHGLTQSNLKAEDGDSGAPVFLPKKDADGGSFGFGIISGGSTATSVYFTEIMYLPVGLQNRY